MNYYTKKRKKEKKKRGRKEKKIIDDKTGQKDVKFARCVAVFLGEAE